MFSRPPHSFSARHRSSPYPYSVPLPLLLRVQRTIGIFSTT
jgi:hypothetical protein